MKKVIYIAEDNTSMQALYNCLLDVDFEVHIASNGKDLLDYIEANGLPDLFILDYDMPKLNGYETLKQLQKRYDLSLIPVLVITSELSSFDNKPVYELGARAIIDKKVVSNQEYLTKKLQLYMDEISEQKEMLGDE